MPKSSQTEDNERMAQIKLNIDDEALEEAIEKAKRQLRDETMSGYDPAVYDDPDGATRLPVSWHGPVAQAGSESILDALPVEHAAIDDTDGWLIKAIHIETEKSSYVDVVIPDE